MNNGISKEFLKGILKENPTLVLLLGMCPALAVTTSVKNAIGMGISSLIVLTCSNVVISLVRKWIPEKVRIASFITIIATFVTMIDLLLKAYLPEISAALGVYIPLIVVNCIILARAEAFASKSSIGRSFVDGLGMGAGFTFALVIIGAVREMLGAGTILGFSLFPESFQPALIFVQPPGAFLVFGCILGVINLIKGRKSHA